MRPALLMTSFMFVALTSMSGTEAWACSCEAPGPACQNAFRVDAVFSGTVRSITELNDDGQPVTPNPARFPRAFRVEFESIVPFRGIDGPTVSVVTSGTGVTCGYSFTQGQRYLVYASRSRDGGFVTGICSRTRPLAEAGEDLRFLESLTAPADAGARIYGTIQHWQRDVATEQPQAYGPVSDVRVIVRGLGRMFEAQTDARGNYQVNVPPGKYEVIAVPPAVFSQRDLQRNVELRDGRACALVDFSVTFDGRIRGIVRQSSGEPAEGVSVQVMAVQDAGKAGYIRTLDAPTDATGTFEFLKVSPGRYVVGVDLTRKLRRNTVFPTTFHPGTLESALATVIELSGGQHIDLEPMMLPAPRRERRMAGKVFFADGKPAAGASVALRDGRSPIFQVGGMTADTDGSFSFVVHEGLSYLASASFWDSKQQQQVVGRLGPIVVSEDVLELRLTLSEISYRAP